MVGSTEKFSQREKAAVPAVKLPFYKLVWIFVVSSVVGVVVETIFCLIFKGYLESRQGMLYGPFNQVYGFGSILLAFVLLHVKDRGILTVFASSALLGGIFETLCSYVQEAMFGTVSWDYSWMPISLFGGRTNLLYMIFFGVLGVLYIYFCFPWLSRLGERIHKGKGVALTWAVAVFLSVNLCLSAVVVLRWMDRQRGFPAVNSVEAFIDHHYTDDRLESIFPTMVAATKAV
jgi:uncharacterized membrane protein